MAGMQNEVTKYYHNKVQKYAHKTQNLLDRLYN